MALFGQNGCIRAKVVVFGQKWLFSDKSGCFRATVVLFGQKGCFWAKVVVFGQNDLLRLYGCIGAKVVVFGQSGFISAK